MGSAAFGDVHARVGRPPPASDPVEMAIGADELRNPAVDRRGSVQCVAGGERGVGFEELQRPVEIGRVDRVGHAERTGVAGVLKRLDTVAEPSGAHPEDFLHKLDARLGPQPPHVGQRAR